MIKPDTDRHRPYDQIYDDAYSLLVQLCEQQAALGNAALLDVMDAFNLLAEYRSPRTLPARPAQRPIQAMTEAAWLLHQLADNSDTLADTLLFARARDLVTSARDELS